MREVLDTLVFEWQGADISLNKFYSSPHWTVRSKEKNFWKGLFSRIPIKDTPPIDEFQITLKYNSRLDVDNTILHCKFLIDYLRSVGILIDDTKRYYRGLHIIPDETMGKKHYILTLEILSYAIKKDKPSRS